MFIFVQEGRLKEGQNKVYITSQVIMKYSVLYIYFVFIFRKIWLSNDGSPKSRIDKCEFNEEFEIDGKQFSTFEIRK